MTVRIWALKEWAATIAALGRGDTIVLLRKGGIAEREFSLGHRDRRVLLYPTHSHQDPRWLKAAYAPLASPQNDVGSRTAGAIADWAEITHCLTPAAPECLQALYSELIWTEEFLQQRLAWQPERPIRVLLLRAYRFPDPPAITERPQGCHSWFEVGLPADTDSLSEFLPKTEPAIPTAHYQNRVDAILQALEVAKVRLEPGMENCP